MFINIENGKLVLYNLKIYKRLHDINYKLSYSGGYEKVVEKDILYIPGLGANKVFDGNKMIRYPYYEGTGKYIEYNDLFSDRRELYNLEYFLFTVPNLYLILTDIIENNDYYKLEDLNDYFKNKNISNEELEIFNKYKDRIYKNLILEEITNLDRKVANKKVQIYNMDISELNHKVKVKK